MRTNEFITSDTHFGHKNILKHAGRPFSSVEEMDRELIARWNAKVPENAVVYHLGDFCLGTPEYAFEVLAQLNGKIRWFLGNHDSWVTTKSDAGQKPRSKYMNRVREAVEWFRPYSFHETKTEDGRLVVMSHYAFDVWNRSHHGAWHLHGHSHGTLPDGGRLRMDVGIDCHPNYEPFSYAEIAQELEGRDPPVLDHHTPRVG